MPEDPFSRKSPEKTFVFSDASIRRIREVAERLDKAINSLYENLAELEEELEQSTSAERSAVLEADILRHKQGIAANEEKQRDFEDAIAHWERELKSSATGILENFNPDKDRPN